MFFNDVVDKLYGRDVRTEKELSKAFNIMCNLQDHMLLDAKLNKAKLDPNNSKELHTFHAKVIAKYWRSKDKES